MKSMITKLKNKLKSLWNRFCGWITSKLVSGEEEVDSMTDEEALAILVSALVESGAPSVSEGMAASVSEPTNTTSCMSDSRIPGIST